MLAALALAAPADARTLRVQDRTLAPGEAVRVSGAGWGTTVGVCAADPIEIRLVRNRRTWRLARVGGLEVAPIAGTFSVAVRIPEGVSDGTARIVATQREHVFELTRGCVDRPLQRLDASVIVFRIPGSSCEEPECTPIVPRPRLGIDRIGSPDHEQGAFWTALPEWNFEAPPPVCPDRPCMRASQNAADRQAFAGSRLWLHGDTWELPDGCSDRVRFTVLDRSGTGWPVGSAVVDEEGRFLASPELPEDGIAPGAATIFAASDARDPRCALVASVSFTLFQRSRIVWTVGALAAGETARVRGLWWGTDRCDRVPELLLSTGGRAPVIKHVRPGRFGSFEVVVRLPGDLPPGARITARQERLREIAGPRGIAKRSRCARALPAKSARSKLFPATLMGVHDGDKLRVTGFGWGGPACGAEPNPVRIERVEGEKAEPIGTATPKGDAIDVFLAAGGELKPGTTIRATQAACAAGEGARGASATTRAPEKPPRS